MEGSSGPGTVLVHVGYHKTGTTWLQDHLFADPAQGFDRPLGYLELHRLLVNPGPFRFDADATAEALRPRRHDLVTVHSAERLSGHPDVGGYDSRTIADRLAEVVPDARILVVVRRQPDLVRSAWGQHVVFGGTERFDQYLEGRLDGVVPRFDPDHLRFQHLVGHYQDRFGPDRVLVLPHERLRADRQGFVDAVRSHVGLPTGVPAPSAPPANPGRSALHLELLRRSNHFANRRRSVNPAPLWCPPLRRGWRAAAKAADRLPEPVRRRADVRLAERAEDWCRGRFAADNRALADRTGLDLGRWGWAVAGG